MNCLVGIGVGTAFQAGTLISVPIAHDISFTVSMDQVNNVPAPGVLGGASGGHLSAVKDTDPSHGVLVLNADGSFTYTPTASYQGLDSFTFHAHNILGDSATQTANLIVVGVTTHFVVLSPSTDSAGVAFNLTVVAQDSLNNTTPVYAGTATFTSSDGQAVLPVNTTLTSGTGIFASTLKTSGLQTITVTDTGNGTITGKSGTITVSAATVTRYIVTAPATSTTAAEFNETVIAQDAYNNTNTTYVGTVHFTGSDGSGIYHVDAPLVAGTGTFATTLITIGSQTLTAIDAHNGSITGVSSAINVIALDPASIALAWFDYRSQYFQHSNGTTPATANSDPVGYVEDLSGNGNHLIQATDANRPLLLNSVQNSRKGLDYTSANTLSLAKTFGSPVSEPFWIFGIYKQHRTDVLPSGNVTVWDGNEDGNSNLSTGIDTSITGSGPSSSQFTSFSPASDGYTGANVFMGISQTAQAVMVEYNGASSKVWVNGVPIADGVDTGTATVLAGLRFGADGVNPGASMYLLAGGTFTGLDSTDITNLFAWASGNYDIQVVAGTPEYLTTVGDSRSTGSPGLANNLFLSDPMVFLVQDVGGNFFEANYGMAASTANGYVTTQVDASYNPIWGKNYVFVQVGTNDLNAGRSVLQTTTDIFTLCDDLQSTGFYVILESILPGWAYPVAEGQVNANLANGWPDHADAYIDYTSNTILGTPGNPTYWDGVHLTTAGYEYLASQRVPYCNPGGTNHYNVTASASLTAGGVVTFTVVAQDASNVNQTGYVGTAQFTSSDGQAVLPGNTVLVSGSAVLTATLKTSGTQTIKATDTKNAGLWGVSSGITVNPATTSQYGILSALVVTPGVGFNVTVNAQDVFNNNTSSYVGTVHFTSSDGAATLPGDTALVSGTGTFAATLNTAGTQTITATDSHNGSITGITMPVTVGGSYDPTTVPNLKVLVWKGLGWFQDNPGTVPWANGQRVLLAEDQSGNGFDFTLVSGSPGPFAASNVLNGLPSLRFTNSGNTESQSLVTVNLGQNQPCTVFLVFRVSATNGGATVVFDSLGNNVLFDINGATLGVSPFVGYAGNVVNITTSDGNFHVVMLQYNGASGSYIFDGNSEVTGQDFGAVNPLGWVLGNLNSGNVTLQLYGDILAFLVYDGIVSSPNKAYSMSGLNAEFGGIF